MHNIRVLLKPDTFALQVPQRFKVICFSTFWVLVCGDLLRYDEVISNTRWCVKRVLTIVRSISNYSC